MWGGVGAAGGGRTVDFAREHRVITLLQQRERRGRYSRHAAAENNAVFGAWGRGEGYRMRKGDIGLGVLE
jgi:hypothetical protein